MNLVTPGLGLIFWQLITFLVVVFVLSRVAWKPILAMLKEREDSIESALAAATGARAELEQLRKGNEELLEEARGEREKMIRDAQVTANSILTDNQEKSRAEAARILEDARQTIQSEKASALAEIRNYAVELSISVAERVIKDKINTDAAQTALVTRYLDEAAATSN